MALDTEDDAMIVELNDQYKQYSVRIASGLDSLSSIDLKKKWNEIQKIESDLEQCQLTLKEMKQEIKALNNKEKWMQTLMKQQQDYQSLKKRLESQRTAVQKDDIHCGMSAKSAAKLQQSQKNTDILKETQKELYQIEANTEDLMVTLDEQHTQLNAIKAKTIASNNLLDGMGRTLKKMKSRWWA